MNTATFWSMIEAAHHQSRGDSAKQHELLIEALFDLSPDDIQEFDQLLWMMMAQAYRADLWDVVWLIECGCGDDAFHDFRNWLIAQGETVYNKVLEDPENLSDMVRKEQRFNTFMTYIVDTARIAYERKTGKEIPETGYRERPVLKGDLTPESEKAGKYPRVVDRIGGCEDETLFD